ncbi:MAG: sulfatase-like hydrolase/transferase [Bacteroidetes bacterium]|nr:sulfatase-like hydrolase/transferase [Bacteroidota bacterium]
MIALTTLSAVFNVSCNKTEEKKSPNIVYILVDDMGYGDVSNYNSASGINTPNVDKIAEEGIRFSDAHSPSSVCTPTRYGILTGRYCWRGSLPIGVLRGYGNSLIEKERTTVASLLQSNGYNTGIVGKWHLGLDWIVKDETKVKTPQSLVSNEFGMVTDMDPELIDFSIPPSGGPLDHGFGYSFILPASLDMEPYCYLENDTLLGIPDEHTKGNDLTTGYTGSFWRAGRMAAGFDFEQVLPTFAKKAVSFIQKNAHAEEPFFLYVPFASPHTPWMPTKEFQGTSKAGQYGDFVQMVDAAVGEIIEEIKNKGIEDNTIIFFTSDNGPFWRPKHIEEYGHRAAHNFRGMKGDAWEGGHRIPFIVKWPDKIKAGSQSDEPITLTNLLATCADILKLNLKKNEGEDSHSILPLLLNNEKEYRAPEAIVQHSSKGFFVVRQENWKLIERRGSGGFSPPALYEPKPGEAAGQLYNLQEDPSETNNLYSKYPDVVKSLKSVLAKYKSTGRSRDFAPSASQ